MFLELTSEFSKVAGYAISTHNSAVFLNACNEQPEEEIEICICKNIQKNCLGINKEVKDIQAENYEMIFDKNK